MKPDKIKIEDLEVFAKHGVFPERDQTAVIKCRGCSYYASCKSIVKLPGLWVDLSELYGRPRWASVEAIPSGRLAKGGKNPPGEQAAAPPAAFPCVLCPSLLSPCGHSFPYLPALAAKSCQFWAFSCDILAKRNGLPDRIGTKF